MSERALLGNRRLVKSFQPFNGDWDAANFEYNVRDTSLQWIKLDGNTHYIEDYFDTDAYVRDSLTIMPIAANMQEAGIYQMVNPGSQKMRVLTLITTQRITDLVPVLAEFRNDNVMLGFPNTDFDFGQILYGRFREFIPTTIGTVSDNVLAPASDQQFGSLEPTTASKLYIYHIVFNVGIPDPISAGILKYPSSRIILDVNIVKEEDIPFLMRQKRTYELAQ